MRASGRSVLFIHGASFPTLLAAGFEFAPGDCLRPGFHRFRCCQPHGGDDRWRDRRAGVFADYRLRVATVLRDYGMHDRAQAPVDSRRAHGVAG